MRKISASLIGLLIMFLLISIIIACFVKRTIVYDEQGQVYLEQYQQIQKRVKDVSNRIQAVEEQNIDTKPELERESLETAPEKDIDEKNIKELLAPKEKLR